MKARLFIGTIALIAAASPLTEARAQPSGETNAQCARDYEAGQEQRNAGKLLSARGTLRACAKDECPDFIRNDCLAWYDEVQEEVPTLVFAARSEGRDLTEASVLLGGRRLASRLDGQVVELDPGSYDIEIDVTGMQPWFRHFMVARGERNRLVQAELVPLGSPTKGAKRVVAPASREPRSALVPGLFTGVGALGLAGFVSLGVWGRSSESRLSGTCAPNCSRDRVDSVRTKYLSADVSLGVGVASLLVGAYLFLEGDESDGRKAQGLEVRAGANGAGVSYRGGF